VTEAASSSEAARPAGGTGGDARPRFSIVTAVFDVEPYLRDFIRSIEAQRFDLDRLEVIAVDDGSTDGSRAILDEWRERSRVRVTILEQPNAGQSAARNAGLRHAQGEWVTFTDPDDMLGPRFFAVADAFAGANPDVELLTARILHYDDRRRVARNAHPRRRQFSAGDRVADLNREPGVFAGGTTSLFRLDRIRATGQEFDARVRPAFEDGHFAATYLLGLPAPRLGLLRRARYLYRKRETPSSAIDRSWADPGRYAAMFEHGYLDVVRRSRALTGTVPEWVQQLLVYELSWYIGESDAPRTRFHVPPELEAVFSRHVADLLDAVDPAVAGRQRVRQLPQAWVDLMAHGYRDEAWHSPVEHTRSDRRMGLQRLAYRYVGAPPQEVVERGGAPIDPPWAKRVALRYLGETRLWERILWLPDDPRIAVRLDGDPAPIARRAEPRGGRGTCGSVVRDAIGAIAARGAARPAGGRRQAVDDLVTWFHARTIGRLRYRDAWVLIDRIHDADDNAERLFEYLRAHRRDVNARFVLEAGTPDWARLARTERRRLVPYGSREWRSLMLNARWLLSSHSDRPITRPAAVLRLDPRPGWKFGFLQHGVIKDDLSPWLNRYQHDLFVVSTQPEYESVAADGTAYRVTAKEVRLTELPRFDRLRRVSASVAPGERDLVIVAPTWRSWLARPLADGSQRHDLSDEVLGSDYLRRWLDLLAAPEIAAAAASRGWRVGFMPHPNLQELLDRIALPGHVEPLRFAGADVQALYARLGTLVTDYSSVAFNAAYLDRPTVYYQFDRARMLSGDHVGRAGYFDYERDGFGPVAVVHADAVAAVVAAIEHGPAPAEPYARRIAATFPWRDGRACERVVAAIEELDRPWQPG
jgi:glycosyltransferase involved in cell wall biosynthesis